MNDPFRDEDAGALARLEHLEDENERLARELDALCDSVGENGDAYVTNLANQVDELRKEIGKSDASTSGEALATQRDLLAHTANARTNAARFRVYDDKSGALAHAERLEAKNAELRQDIETFKDRSGANRSYVEHLEKELADLKAKRAIRDLQPLTPPKHELTAKEKEIQLWAIGGLAALFGLVYLIQWLVK